MCRARFRFAAKQFGHATAIVGKGLDPGETAGDHHLPDPEPLFSLYDENMRKGMPVAV